MATYFADTSFWIAIVDRNDKYHEKAIHSSAELNGSLITTQAILLETANTFSRQAWRAQAIALINHLFTRPDVEIVALSDVIWKRGWKLYVDGQDKSWSFTDCVSFEVMTERGMSDALSSDSNFRQAGFRELLLD